MTCSSWIPNCDEKGNIEHVGKNVVMHKLCQCTCRELMKKCSISETKIHNYHKLCKSHGQNHCNFKLHVSKNRIKNFGGFCDRASGVLE
jgi:hypothetical protein